jgi:sigma-B regulation protein RsbU (phosphoserine phosphatase)
MTIKKRIVVWGTSLAAAVVIAAGIFMYYDNYNDVLKGYRKVAEFGAEITANGLKGFDPEEILKNGQDDHYKMVETNIQTICKGGELAYLYVFVPNIGEKTITYLYVASFDDNPELAEERALGATVSSNMDWEKIYKDIAENKDTVPTTETDNVYGKVVTWFEPIYGKDNSIAAWAGADISIDEITNSVFCKVVRNIVIFTLLIGFIFAVSITAVQKQIEKIVKVREREKAELETARKIQLGILPSVKQYENDKRFAVNAFLQPAKEVGGDLYDFFLAENRYLYTVIGDVSGKGIAAALFMTIVKTLIKDIAVSLKYPSDILTKVNGELILQNGDGMFVTVFLGCLDLETGEYLYCNAGHNPPITITDKTQYLNCQTGIVLGLFDDVSDVLTDETLQLNERQGILLYTDGVTDCINIRNEFFGQERLAETIKENCSVMFLQDRLAAFRGKADIFDDMTALQIEFLQKENEFTITLDTKLDNLSEVKEFVTKIAGAEQMKKVYLCAEEIFVNIVNYSGSETVTFTGKTTADKTIITITDNGIRFNPLEIPEPDLDGKEIPIGGFGIHFVKQNTSSLSYVRNEKEKQNILVLEFRACPH